MNKRFMQLPVSWASYITRRPLMPTNPIIDELLLLRGVRREHCCGFAMGYFDYVTYTFYYPDPEGDE